MSTPEEPAKAGEPAETDDERRAKGLPPEPSPAGEEREPVNAPTAVNWSFGLWIASGVMLIVGFTVLLFAKQIIIDQVVKTTTDKRIPREQIESGVTSLLWVLVVGSVVFALLFALFAYKMREGTRSARTVLVVLGAFVVLLLLAFQLVSPLILLSVLLAVIGTVLMYLPKVQPYFPKVGRKLP